MDAGADAKLLADRLGHDVTTMLKVYTHRTQGRDREIARKMAGLIEAAINPDTAPEKEAPATESATDQPM